MIYSIKTKDKRKGIHQGDEVIETFQELNREIKIFGITIYRKVIDFDIELEDKAKKKTGY